MDANGAGAGTGRKIGGRKMGAEGSWQNHADGEGDTHLHEFARTKRGFYTKAAKAAIQAESWAKLGLGGVGAQDELFGEVGLGGWVAGLGSSFDFSERRRGWLGENGRGDKGESSQPGSRCCYQAGSSFSKQRWRVQRTAFTRVRLKLSGVARA